MRKRALSALIAGACVLGLSQANALEKSKVSAQLNQLIPNSTSEAAPQGVVSNLFESRSLMRIEGNFVYIDALASESATVLLNDLRGLGLQKGESYRNLVSGRLPIDSIEAMGELASLQQAWPVMATTSGLVSPPSEQGLVVSQGDIAQQSDLVKIFGNITGRGQRVGSLSDTYDCAPGAATDAADDIANGDLPSDVIILDDSLCDDGGTGSDEGRAMMQIVRDVAPGASQAFHTAFGGQADFANGIIELQEAGSTVIVDDVIYFAEPMFQDGSIAQAADTVRRRGATYFSSAGNNGRDAWEAFDGFQSAGETGAFGGLRHDFDPGDGVASLQRLDLDGPTQIIFSFQWDDPAASVSGRFGKVADTDMDVLFYSDAEGNNPILQISGISFNLGGDPIEVFGLAYSGAEPTTLWMGLELFEGPEPGFMKYVYFESALAGGVADAEFTFPTFSGSIYGHANSYWAIATGAAAWFRTPYFLPAIFPIPSHNGFSSAGPTPIFYSTGGNLRAAGPAIRLKPEFVAPDGGDNTFFGSDLPEGFGAPGEPSGFPNFFGTSAAAPHAAGAAALLLEVDPNITPTQVKNYLRANAIDMDDRDTEGFDTGFDFRTGKGYIQAGESVLAVAKRGPNRYLVCLDGIELTLPLESLLEAIGEGGKLGVCTESEMPDE